MNRGPQGRTGAARALTVGNADITFAQHRTLVVLASRGTQPSCPRVEINRILGAMPDDAHAALGAFTDAAGEVPEQSQALSAWPGSPVGRRVAYDAVRFR